MIVSEPRVEFLTTRVIYRNRTEENPKQVKTSPQNWLCNATLVRLSELFELLGKCHIMHSLALKLLREYFSKRWLRNSFTDGWCLGP